MKKLIIILILAIYVNTVRAQGFTDATASHLPQVVKRGYNSMDAAVADIDSDGDQDIIIGVEFLKNIILLNDGTGKFSDGSFLLPDIPATEEPKPYPYYPYHDTEDIAVSDFDKDGDADIIFVSEDDQVNEYYLNDGSGKFTDATSKLPFRGISNAVIAADFDGDGFTDLMVGNKGQNFYIKNVKGVFSDETSKRLPEIEDITQDLEASDFDGDGDLDVIIGNEKENVLLENDGRGYFTDITLKFIDPTYLESGETREADFADINGDGRLDLYFANVTMFQQMAPVQRMLINTVDGFIDQTNERLGFTTKYNVIDGDFADLDHDGDADLLLATFQGPRIMKNDGEGKFIDVTEKELGVVRSMGVDIEVADFNGDGKADIYFANFRGSDMLFLQNPGIKN